VGGELLKLLNTWPLPGAHVLADATGVGLAVANLLFEGLTFWADFIF
jgi:hypothetical protein